MLTTRPVRSSRLPPSAGNRFQTIKTAISTARAAGKTIYDLSIGQPTGPAFIRARIPAAEAIMSDDEGMHQYQDNGSIGIPDFGRRFVQCHVERDLSFISSSEINFLPIPGIKPMLQLVPIACGASRDRTIEVATMTDPGYPTPAYWCNALPGIYHHAINLNPQNKFLFETDQFMMGDDTPDLIMLNYPHNPSGKAADKKWLTDLCAWASEHNVRVFNDAAYAILSHSDVHTTLTDVALKFPRLSWAEAFSASKAGNLTGWRIGAMAGSPDFIGDIAKIKGDADSGFAAPLAAGVISVFEKNGDAIMSVKQVYAERIKLLTEILTKHGMRLAVTPDAGFFTLWLTPKRAFGIEIRDAEQFNKIMINRTGVVGVDFDPYMRYAVTGHIQKMAPDLTTAFSQAAVSY